MKKVTVWLTSYNHANYIEESIKSILQQTYKDFEFYIVDDCSQDNSWDIIQQYAKQDTRIKAIKHKYNWGTSGLKLMIDDLEGQYIAIAHCDDVWKPEKLEKQLIILEEKSDIAACFTLVDIIDDDSNIIQDVNHVYYSVFEQPNRSRTEWLRHFFYNGNCLCHPSVLIRKEAYSKYQLFANGLNGYPDFYSWIRLCKKAEIYIIQEKLTCFRTHNDESNTSGENPESIIRITNEESFVFKEFLSLIDTHEILSVFPETEKYVVNHEMNEKFIMARLLIEGERKPQKYLGMNLLYELFQNKEAEEQIKRLYGYTQKDFNQEKQKYDIFDAIPQNRYMNAGLYFDFGDDNSEEGRYSINAYIKNSGEFQIKFDLSKYSTEVLERGVRLDLDEGVFRKFQGITCKNADQTIPAQIFNGVREGSWDMFYTTDPQYSIMGLKNTILEIHGKTEEIPQDQIERHLMELNQEILNLKNQIIEKNKKQYKKVFFKNRIGK